MAFPKLLQKLFQNNGAGDKLNKSILPDISYNDLTNKPTIPAAVTVDAELSATSENPVQNKVVTAGINSCMPGTPAAIELNPGTGAIHGGFIDFHYKGSTEDYTARIIEGINGKGRLDIQASGGLYLNNQKVLTGSSAGLTVVAESYSANSWYRKYSDGWIEQGGYCNVKSRLVSFNVAFTDAKTICVVAGESWFRDDGDYVHNVKLRANNTTSFSLSNYNSSASDTIGWVAFGK